jgi:hypothetical protein
MWLLDLRKQTALRGIFMIGRFGLILFTVLFLFGCASCDKNKVAQIDQSNSEESINKKYTTKYSETFIGFDNKEISSFLIDFSKITNQKEALNFLGNPYQKIPCFLIINPKNNPSYELVEIWHWNKPTNIHIMFNKEKKIHEKVQVLLNFNKK